MCGVIIQNSIQLKRTVGFVFKPIKYDVLKMISEGSKSFSFKSKLVFMGFEVLNPHSNFIKVMSSSFYNLVRTTWLGLLEVFEAWLDFLRIIKSSKYLE